MEARLLLSAVFWTGTAGDNNWDTPENWSTDAVPGSSDDATINVAADILHSDNIVDAVNSLTSNQPLTIANGTLSVATTSTISADLTISGGTFGGAGDMTVGGVLTLSRGTIDGTGTVTANGGIALDGSLVEIDGKALVNPAGQTASLTGIYDGFTLLDGAVIVNDGTFNVQSAAGTVNSEGNTGTPVAFTNNGAFLYNDSGQSFSLNDVPFNVTSTGTVEVQAGTLQIGAGGGGGASSGGMFTADADGTLDFAGGTYSLDASSSIGGPGTVGFAGNETIAAPYDVTGTTVFQAGTANFTGSIVTIGSTVIALGGTANLGTNPINTTTLTVTNGTLNGSGDIAVSGLTTFNSNGDISGSGTVTADGGIDLTDGFTTIDGKTLVNPAGETASLTGIYDGFTLLNGTVIVNDGTFNVQSAGGAVNSEGNTGAPVAFTNNGAFLYNDSGQSFAISNVPFNVTSTGTVEVQAGTLLIGAGGGGGASSGGMFTADADGTVDFAGGTYSLDASSSIGGPGTVGFAGNETIAVPYDVTGTTVFQGGTANFTAPIVTIGSTVMALGGTANLGANPISPTTLTVTNGTLNGSGDIVVSGLTTFNGTGDISGSGTVTADGGINLSGGLTTIDGKTLVNPAGQTASLTGIYDGFTLLDGAVIVNYGTFNVQSTGGVVNSEGNTGAPVAFANNGAFLFDNIGQTFTINDVSFNVMSTGTVEVQAGTLRLDGGGMETSASFTIDSGAVLDVSGSGTSTYTFDSGTSLMGAGTLSVSGYGNVVTILSSNPALTGPTDITSATLLVDGSQTNSAVTMSQGILGGTGTVGPVTSSGTINPGTAPATGILSVQGDVTTNAQAIFKVSLQGSEAGTGFDQLAVTGAADIAGSTLNASVSGFTPTKGEMFPILTSTAPIVGTFAGLAEGAALVIDNVPFTISYVGDPSGDDVVLTQTDPTSTTLSSSVEPSDVGEPVTFTAVVESTFGIGTPTGTVTFSIDGNPQDAVPLEVVDGQDEASLPAATDLSKGNHVITAVYSGDDIFIDSTAAPLIQSVGTIATITALASSANPSNPGQSVIFTATVTPITGEGTPTGTVTFSIDGQAQAPVPLAVAGDQDEASLPAVVDLALGDHTITAAYNGDDTFGFSTAFPLTQAVIAVAATTVLASSVNPSNPGQSVVFTATVAPTTGEGTPTGTVTFSIDGQAQVPVSLAVVDGQDEASLPALMDLAMGNHTITAVYNGDDTFGFSAAFPLVQSVGTIATTTVLASSANPSNSGQSVIFTATVASTTGEGTPTGTVTFSIDGQAQAPVSLAVVDSQDEASLSAVLDLAIGDHTITAAYNGDDSFGFSMASPLNQSVAGVTAIATTTVLASSANPSNPGQSVIVTATVASTTGEGMPTGTVTFSIDGQAQAPVSLAMIGGQDEASLPALMDLAMGDHTITAVYDGDDTFAVSTATPLTQSVGTIATTTTLTSSANPSNPGQSVILTATVIAITGAGAPTGTVTFSIDGQVQAPVSLAVADGQDQASLPPSTELSGGNHTITAIYGGDDTFAASTAAPLSQVVSTIDTNTQLTTSLTTSLFNQSVTFMATVAPVTGTIPPAGTVNFLDGPNVIGTETLDSRGTATFSTSTLALGLNEITAAYSGNSDFVGSTSTMVNQMVQVDTTTRLTASLNSSNGNQSVMLAATVTSTVSGGTATGEVDFVENTSIIGTASLLNGVATLTIGSFSSNAQAVTAQYIGDGPFLASTSLPVIPTVLVPTMTSLVTAPNPASEGQAVTLTATVSGVPTPVGSVTFEDGTTMLGSAALGTNGVATFVDSSLTTGIHSLTAVFGATANFLASTSNPVSQVVSAVAPEAPPTVVSFQRFGFHEQPTILVLTFSEALAPGPAQDGRNYHIVLKSGDANTGGVFIGGTVAVSRAIYEAATNSVMLFTSPRLNVHDIYQITVNGMSLDGLTSATGVALAGTGTAAGTNYVAPIKFRTLAGRFTKPLPAALRQMKNSAKVLSKLSLTALDALIESNVVSVRSIIAARQLVQRKSPHHGFQAHHGIAEPSR